VFLIVTPAMECDPGVFERIVETKHFHVKPAVSTIGRHDLLRFAFSAEVSQYSDDSIDSDKTVRRRLYFYYDLESAVKLNFNTFSTTRGNNYTVSQKNDTDVAHYKTIAH